jgi:hypothetical protein
MSDALSTTHRIAENAGQQRPQALQSTLEWAPDGAPAVALVDANRNTRRRRDGIRGDARRTAEYLAQRGKTPVEALHDLVGMGWLRGMRALKKELKVSEERAYELWERAVVHLLPYTAARFETIELGPNAAGGMALGHFLAARAMGEALAASQPERYHHTVSRDRQSLDIEKTQVSHGVSQGETVMELPGLPPRAAD